MTPFYLILYDDVISHHTLDELIDERDEEEEEIK